MDYCLVYLSTATKLFDINDLLYIGEQANRFNAKRDISGMLIYSGKHFIQVLEGSKPRVEALYDKIVLDSRHDHCIHLLSQRISKRSFSKWYMGVLDLTGHKDLDTRTLQNMAKHASKNPETVGFTVLALLKTFRSMLPDPEMESDRAA